MQRYVELLDRWRRVTNLISERGFAKVWERHIEDSIYVQRISPTSRRWLDIGSGAGLPGIVIGILLSDEGNAEVHCVESDGRKCAFLRQVVMALDIPVRVHNTRAEHLAVADVGPIDVVTGRAFSSLQKILDLADEYLARGAIAILPRGKSYASNIESFDSTRYIIKVDRNPGHEDGAILTIRKRADGLNG